MFIEKGKIPSSPFTLTEPFIIAAGPKIDTFKLFALVKRESLTIESNNLSFIKSIVMALVFMPTGTAKP